MFINKRYSNLLINAGLAFALLLLAAACNKGGGEGVERQSFNVPVATVAQTIAPGYTEVTGTVTGTTAVPVATKLFSAITYMGFEEGDRVNKGDVLVRIDDSDIQAMRNEAAAYRAEAAAALAEVETVVAQGEAGKALAEPLRRKTAPRERRPTIISDTQFHTKTGGTETVVNSEFSSSQPRPRATPFGTPV